MTVTIPCSCDAEEHRLDVEAESVGYGIHARTGLHSPRLGDPLPCGRSFNVDDFDTVIARLEAEPDPDD